MHAAPSRVVVTVVGRSPQPVKVTERTVLQVEVLEDAEEDFVHDTQ